MLVSAKNWEEDVKSNLREYWYDLKYQYFFGNFYEDFNVANDDYWKRQFVYFNDYYDDRVKGYFSYDIDRDVKSISNIGLISFGKKQTNFIQEVVNHLDWLMTSKTIDRIEFFAYEDNPAIKSYRRLVKRFGGEQAGKFTNSQRLYDGKLHNIIFFEVLREDYEKTDYYKRKHGGTQ